MVLIGAVLPLFASPVAPPNSVTDWWPPFAASRRPFQLAAQEYRIGVSGGRVIAPQEVAEASLFLKEARRTAAC